MDTYKPGFMNAQSAHARMDALCELIEFWLGPRIDEYGEALSEVNAMSLPMPLRRLYQFAGRWPGFDKQNDSSLGVGAFSKQDALIPMKQTEVNEKGLVSFLAENQGVWVCRTNTEGDDPPVWCEGDFYDFQTNEFISGESVVCDSLSRFLVTFVLQEIAFGSRFSLYDAGLSALFEANKTEAIPVWLNGPYMSDWDYNFYLWRDTLVAEISASFHFGANSTAGIDFLTKHQGPIIEIDFMIGISWRLIIRQDGSANVCYQESTINEIVLSAPDTIGEFDNLAKRLNDISLPKRLNDQNVVLFLHRKGQTHCCGRFLCDTQFVTDLSRMVIAKTNPPNETLSQLFQERWPYH